jgi:hypothetical protein
MKITEAIALEHATLLRVFDHEGVHENVMFPPDAVRPQ